MSSLIINKHKAKSLLTLINKNEGLLNIDKDKLHELEEIVKLADFIDGQVSSTNMVSKIELSGSLLEYVQQVYLAHNDSAEKYMKFSVGDEVKCVNDLGTDSLDASVTYFIDSIEYGGSHVTVQAEGSDAPVCGTYSIRRFESIHDFNER